MTTKKNQTHTYMTLLVVGIFIGVCIGITLHLAFPYIEYVEIQPSPMENPLNFYMNVLKDQGYTVKELGLSTNTYDKVTFKEFLWILQTTNRTTCYIDYGEVEGILKRRVAKLWIGIDGIYYEVRFKGVYQP